MVAPVNQIYLKTDKARHWLLMQVIVQAAILKNMDHKQISTWHGILLYTARPTTILTQTSKYTHLHTRFMTHKNANPRSTPRSSMQYKLAEQA